MPAAAALRSRLPGRFTTKKRDGLALGADGGRQGRGAATGAGATADGRPLRGWSLELQVVRRCRTGFASEVSERASSGVWEDTWPGPIGVVGPPLAGARSASQRPSMADALPLAPLTHACCPIASGDRPAPVSAAEPRAGGAGLPNPRLLWRIASSACALPVLTWHKVSRAPPSSRAWPLQ